MRLSVDTERLIEISGCISDLARVLADAATALNTVAGSLANAGQTCREVYEMLSHAFDMAESIEEETDYSAGDIAEIACLYDDVERSETISIEGLETYLVASYKSISNPVAHISRKYVGESNYLTIADVTSENEKIFTYIDENNFTVDDWLMEYVIRRMTNE